jgi:hypothetical protein
MLFIQQGKKDDGKPPKRFTRPEHKKIEHKSLDGQTDIYLQKNCQS